MLALAEPEPETIASIRRAAAALAGGGARLVLVVGTAADVIGGDRAGLAAALPSTPVVLVGSAEGAGSGDDPDWMAQLWLAITDRSEVVVEVPAGTESLVGADLAAALRALKLVLTDPGGGWGSPAKSFVDVHDPERGFEAALADRQGGAVVAAVRTALAGGVTSVNLCPPEQVDEELFTFDGVGSLFTSGDYLRLDPLRVDDLPAVEELVAQGVADGLLRPRSRLDVARLAVTGLGARVQSSGHLAGLVGLDVSAYAAEGLGEVASLYTVSRFSGAGAGGLLVDGLAEHAAALGLRAVFAVTVSADAAAFFARKGFTEVGHDAVPPAKWAGYDASRKAQARVFWRDVDGSPGGAAGF
ncbi:GNAT family N-acetyltransferase [Aquihabitans sp. G128]|uniref:GNAT family N-acetyltransferase n=1 Tax=Aquihabitans sp. G128 TaxID=2849779 RepID=UPI001C239427|nr:GNAT family N-acetyltransferase [Aquihabitans sp. G128]QXC63007.1 GNAT family N-acetyltransferase [Aquihabitans sp. G128]